MAAPPPAAFPTPSVDAGRGHHAQSQVPVYGQPQPQSLPHPHPHPQAQPQPQLQQPSRRTDASSSTSSLDQKPPQQQQQQQPPTKRRRIGYACNLCRTKKNRCDGERPSCGPCKERRQECVYSPQRTKISVTQEYIENLRARNRMLEEHIASGQSHNSHSPHETTYSKDSPFAAPRLSSDYNPGDASQQQQQYPKSSSPTSTAEERSEHQRPRYDRAMSLSEQSTTTTSRQHPADTNLRNDQARSSHSALPGEYFGESSAFDFIAKVTSPNTTDGTAGSSAAATGTPATGASSSGTTNPKSSTTGRLPTAIAARRSIAEASGLSSGMHSESLAESSPSTVVFEELLGIGGGIGDGSGSSDLFELPQRPLADRLVASYFKHRHPLNPCLHEGTFRQRYARLWLSKDVGGEEAAPNNLAWLGLVNMVFAFGSDHVQIRPPYQGSPNGSTSTKPDRTRFFKRAKMLAFSSILQARIELVQALLLMSHFLHGSLELNHCWTVIGLAIRTAQELGLYLDPTNFTNDIIEQEIRKRVWWGCFVIDRLVSIKVGRPPTIHDIPAIRVGLPLAVDDEYLNEEHKYSQPSHTPSKIEYFSHIVTQCRLLAKVLDTLYDNTPSTSGSGAGGSSASSSAGRETRVRIKADLPDLLAMSIQLDGELVVWQSTLPPHLRADSEISDWHFARQRNVLLMRFLHIRLLIHRQTLLYHILRRISDPFQLDLAHLCIRRCVSAAYDAIAQVHLVKQNKQLSSSWHNSHYVFTALSVLLVFQHLDPHSRLKIDIPPSLDIDDAIGQGLEHLQRVGGEIHPLASRYVRSFQQLQTRLQAIGTLSANAPPLAVRGKQAVSVKEDVASNYGQAHTTSTATDPDQSSGNNGSAESGSGKASMAVPDQSQEHSGANYYSGEGYQTQDNNDRGVDYGDDGFIWSGFDDEFAVIQSALLDSTGWGPGFLDPWTQG
ncbi:N-terminal binuclear Zn cluster-containing/DNA binding domain-containing protein [Trichoderma chlorosporum]